MKILKLSKGILFFMFALFSFNYVFAQEKFDSVYMKNGDVNVGKITSINDDAISFTYKGETLGYNFKSADINKIVFSSGRVQNFGAANSEHSGANTAVNNADVDPIIKLLFCLLVISIPINKPIPKWVIKCRMNVILI